MDLTTFFVRPLPPDLEGFVVGGDGPSGMTGEGVGKPCSLPGPSGRNQRALVMQVGNLCLFLCCFALFLRCSIFGCFIFVFCFPFFTFLILFLRSFLCLFVRVFFHSFLWGRGRKSDYVVHFADFLVSRPCEELLASLPKLFATEETSSATS